MRITNVPMTPDATGAYRCMWPMRHLGLNGHTILMPKVEETRHENGLLDWRFHTERIPEPLADIWMIQFRWEQDWTSDLIPKIRQSGAAIVIECDDNYIETPPNNPSFLNIHPYRSGDRIVNRAERRGRRKEVAATLKAQGIRANANYRHTQKLNPSFYANQKNTKNRVRGLEMMQAADAVITSTPHLANLYAKYNENVYVIRNYLEWELWEPITPQYEVERDRLRIGYLGAFGWRQNDLNVLKPFMGDFMRKHPECDFVANTLQVHDFLGIPEEQRVTVGEYRFYGGHGAEKVYPVAENTACLDIGLVPLAANNFNEGKSHLKGMEYNAAGIPFIASDTESYRYWTDEGENGFIVSRPDQWLDRLETLVGEPRLRDSMGWAGREKAREHSLDRQWKKWERAMGEIMGPFERQAARHSIKHGAVQKVSEMENLLKATAEIEPKLIVEVGSARGGTIWGFSQVATDDALIVSIDMPAGSPLDVRGGKDVYTGRNRERIRTYVKDTQRCVLIDGDSQSLDTLKRLVDTTGCQQIDVLMIDADHRYEGVKRDYELYSPLVRKGGIIAFHDIIAQNDLRSGVHILWNQLKKKYRYQEFIGRDDWGMGDWGGIGILYV